MKLKRKIINGLLMGGLPVSLIGLFAFNQYTGSKCTKF